MTTEMRFGDVLAAWRAASEAHQRAAEAYRLAHGRALCESLGKNAEVRKADADEATAVLRERRDVALLDRVEAHHRLIWVRGSAGESQRGDG